MRRLVSTAYYAACVGTIIALAVVSLLPADSLQRTELGGHGEHLLAYTGVGALLGIGGSRRTWLPLLLALISYAGLLEGLQLLVPGRNSQIGDFLYSAIGVVLGLLLSWLLHAFATLVGPCWTAGKDRQP